MAIATDVVQRQVNFYNRTRHTVVFRDDDTGVVYDPTQVSFEVDPPSGLTTTYVYGTHAVLTKLSTGTYRIFLDHSIAGTFYTRWRGQGPTSKNVTRTGMVVVRDANIA
jgi:hypothetical protein